MDSSVGLKDSGDMRNDVVIRNTFIEFADDSPTLSSGMRRTRSMPDASELLRLKEADVGSRNIFVESLMYMDSANRAKESHHASRVANSAAATPRIVLDTNDVVAQTARVSVDVASASSVQEDVEREEREEEACPSLHETSADFSNAASGVQRQGLDDTRASVALRLDGATTVAVQNLRSKCSQSDFMLFVHQVGFVGKYDFLYVPTCWTTGKTKGNAFVNFTSADAAVEFGVICKSQQIKFCRAAVQGFEALMSCAMVRKAKRVRNADYKPIIHEQTAVK
eukprot:TRINITY_DN17213_c0_g1_i1.p1 TRINITY_DN17213_c0_g1~~TRINITY_DN17213_c0_g1_i1.p1  ORF type:complete len:281 (+),score=53.40 TRINITY_DN17213_c0_g1_i1:72-914(+)